MQIRHVVWLFTLGLITAMFCALAPRAAWHQTLVERYRPLLHANTLIENHYVSQVTPRQLTDGALRGLMSALDPYSGYLTPEQLTTYKDHLAGKIVGIGVEVAVTADGRIVVSPNPGSPSETAGMLAGDRLISIDDVPTREQSIFAINAALAGKPNSRVSLVVERDGESEPLLFEIERTGFESESVRGHARVGDGWEWFVPSDKRIAHIRIADFGESMIEQFNAAFEQCIRSGANGLILDLRNNPGGLVPQAIELIDRFVGESTLPVLTTQAQEGALTKFKAHGPGTNSDIVMVVLTNRYSASAAEIVAGSLQDHERATVVGEQTFGKGSVQYLRELQGGGAVRLTSAYYRLPKGRIVHREFHESDDTEWGIIPDIPVSNDSPDSQDKQLQTAIDLLTKRLDS